MVLRKDIYWLATVSIGRGAHQSVYSIIKCERLTLAKTFATAVTVKYWLMAISRAFQKRPYLASLYA